MTLLSKVIERIFYDILPTETNATFIIRAYSVPVGCSTNQPQDALRAGLSVAYHIFSPADEQQQTNQGKTARKPFKPATPSLPSTDV